jgi:hypothetical protein
MIAVYEGLPGEGGTLSGKKMGIRPAGLFGDESPPTENWIAYRGRGFIPEGNGSSVAELKRKERGSYSDLAGATNCVVTNAAKAFSWLPKRSSKACFFSGLKRDQTLIIFSAVPIKVLAWVSVNSVMEGVYLSRHFQAYGNSAKPVFDTPEKNRLQSSLEAGWQSSTCVLLAFISTT